MTTTPSYPATLSFNRADCADTPETVTAVSLTPDKDKKIWVLDNELSATGPRLVRNGSSAPYMVFALPDPSRSNLALRSTSLAWCRRNSCCWMAMASKRGR